MQKKTLIECQFHSLDSAIPRDFKSTDLILVLLKLSLPMEISLECDPIRLKVIFSLVHQSRDIELNYPIRLSKQLNQRMRF